MVNELRTFTNKEYREHFNVSARTALYDLQNLVKHGLAEARGKRKARYYIACGIDTKIAELNADLSREANNT